MKKFSSGIDDLLRDYKPQRVEERKPIVVVGEDKFAKVLEEYKKFLDEYSWASDTTLKTRKRKESITHVLNPTDINQFLQMSTLFFDHENWSDNTGIYVSKLIQNSYDAGNTNFTLNTENLPEVVNWLGSHLCSERKKLKLTIEGDVGDCAGTYIHSVLLRLDGNARAKFGTGARDSRLFCTGNVHIGCGDDAKRSYFDINGDVGYGYAIRAKESTFVFRANVGNVEMPYAEDCVFKTTNKKTFEKMQSQIPWYSNKVLLVKYNVGRK